MPHNYYLQEADLEVSAVAIQQLWIANLFGHTQESAPAKLRLGYVANPAGQGCIVLLHTSVDGTAVGIQGLHPRTFYLGTKRLRAVGMADFAVESGHRSLGPALMLMRFCARVGAERFDLIYGLPNQKAAPVLVRAGFRRVGVVRRYAILLGSQARLSHYFPSWLVTLTAPVVDTALIARDFWRSKTTSLRLVCEPADWDNAEVDALWALRSTQLLLSERSCQTLRWRFGVPGRGPWKFCLCRDPQGVVRGYVVWRIVDGFAEIGDFFSADPETWTTPVLIAFMRLARQLRVTSVSVAFFGNESVVEGLLVAGMTLRPQEAPLFKLPGGPLELDAAEHWYLTSFDNDAD